MKTQIHSSYQYYNGNPNQYATNQKARKMIENFSYGLTDEIGKGFSSKVFKGKNDQTGELVAVKVIDLQMLKTPLHHALLQSEIEALSIINHPNIMKLHKVFQTSNNTYLITEYCDTGDLASSIIKTGKQPEKSIQLIMHGVVQGYKEMKKKGIIHRDLKPANILLHNGIPKIADFGFATTPNSPPMLPNVNVGSPLYMSPQALKQNRYSDKSDIWAIGVSTYELLYGQVPWQAGSEKELAYRIITLPVLFPQGVNITQDCQDFIKQCLIVDENARISVDQMDNHPWITSITHQIASKVMQSTGSHFQASKQLPSYTPIQQQEPFANNSILSEFNKDFSFNHQGKLKTDHYGKENTTQKRAFVESNSVQPKDKSIQNETNMFSNTPKRQELQNQVQVRQSSLNKNQIARQNTHIQETDQSLSKKAALLNNNSITDTNIMFRTERFLVSQYMLRNTVNEQSYPFTNHQNQVKPQIVDVQPLTSLDIKRNDNILLSQINFCRYLHRVGNLIVKVPYFTSHLMKEKMSFFVQKNIMIKIDRLKEMVTNPSLNNYKLISFGEYSQSNSFNKISQVITSYYQKFSVNFSTLWLTLQPQRTTLQQDKKFDAIFDENLTEFESFYIILLSVLRNAVRELNCQLDETLKVSDKEPDQQLPLLVEEGVVLLDYLVTYFQLTALILDQFNEHEIFATQSKIEQIADGKPVRLTYGHFLEIRNKILQLEI